jgi:hypothetical protein
MDLLNLLKNLLGPLIVGIIVGLVLQWLGKKEIENRIRGDAIRDLMTFRGDYASQDFRRSLNKVSIIFHNDAEIRLDVRHLYELINNPASPQKTIERSIVGLIYKLCQKNGFEGLTEYDIDQSFPESKQSPQVAIFDESKSIQVSQKKETEEKIEPPKKVEEKPSSPSTETK